MVFGAKYITQTDWRPDFTTSENTLSNFQFDDLNLCKDGFYCFFVEIKSLRIKHVKHPVNASL